MNIKIVGASKKYWEFILELRNKFKENFGQIEEILYEDHCIFMDIWRDYYRVAVVDGEPAGFIGAVRGDVRICVDTPYQRNGVGKELLNYVINDQEIFNSVNLATSIRVENEASLKLFESCGFKRDWISLRHVKES